MEPFHLKQQGAQWYHTSDYKTAHLSKASLGKFMYEVLKIGAHIGEIWPFNPKYDRSAVFFTIFMTEEMKNELEVKFEGKITFKDPPKIKLNGR